MDELKGFALRSLQPDDRARILGWRNSERVRSKMYTDHMIGAVEHDRWFDAALAAQHARYFVFEHRGRPIGFVSFTGIDARSQRCSWAFYLGEAEVPWGSALALEYLALSKAFDELGLRKLCCEVLAFNAAALKLHRRFGFRTEAHHVAHVRKGERFEDVMGLALFRDDWIVQRDRLHALCFRAGTAAAQDAEGDRARAINEE